MWLLSLSARVCMECSFSLNCENASIPQCYVSKRNVEKDQPEPKVWKIASKEPITACECGEPRYAKRTLEGVEPLPCPKCGMSWEEQKTALYERQKKDHECKFPVRKKDGKQCLSDCPVCGKTWVQAQQETDGGQTS